MPTKGNTGESSNRQTRRHPELVATLAPRFVAIPDAQRMLGIGRTSIFELLRTGQLESAKFGRRRLISVDSLETLAAGDLAEASNRIVAHRKAIAAQQGGAA